MHWAVWAPSARLGGRKGTELHNSSKDTMSNHTVANHPDLGDVKATLTSFLHGAKDWWKSPRGTVVRIEFLLGVVAISMLYLAVFGSLRRRRRGFFAQKLVLAAYLSVSLVSYTLGSMQSSSVKSSVYPMWAISICILAGSTNSIITYSLDDNSQQMKQKYEIGLCMFYALLIAATVFKNALGILLCFDVFGLAIVKWMQRNWACMTASRSWNLNKMVADYMHQEHTMSGSSYDPASMKGYRYLVDWPLDKSKLEADTLYAAQVTRPGADAAHKVIDLEKIWQCKSLSSEQRDICLSFSLFHLLRRRFFGFECGESSQLKTHDFVFMGLFAKKKKKNATDGAAGDAEAATVDYDWVFKVIEVELAFMYDFFFTKYAAIYYCPWAPALLGLILIIFALVLLAPVVAGSSSNAWRMILHVRNQSTVTTTTTIEVVVTLLMFVCIALLELLQILLYWMTIWGRVYLACESVRMKEAPHNTRAVAFLIKICMCLSNSYLYCFPGKNKFYWQNKLGQYSLLESVLYNYNPNPSKALRAFMNFGRIINIANEEVLHPVNNSFSVGRMVRKPRKLIDVELSAEVKGALVQCLERTQGDLTNGQSSLLLNGASDLLWACRHDDVHPYSGTSCCSQKKENQARFILTWHIATCCCEMEAPKNPVAALALVGGASLKRHIDVATQMSKYCAYLVVNEPKLLPGHHYDTTCVFDAVALEAVESLLLSEKPERLAEEDIFHKGVRLWEQLKRMGEGTRWKVLADFWVEMLLYVAPSDNVKEHIESLANGGELITHLWALLTHAGILDRGPRNIIDIEIAGPHQHQPAPATNDDNHMQPGTDQQQANPLQNVEGKETPGAHNSAIEVEEIIEY